MINATSFAFINDNVLRKNLDMALDHIVDLLTLSESESYKSKAVLVSSLRKTIIIHSASIIEAFLLWKLKQKIKSKELELSDEWKYFDIKIIYSIDKFNSEIIAGKRKKEKKDLDRLDFLRIIDFCLKYKIIDKTLFDILNKVRLLRNRLHIGGLKEIEKKYTRDDLRFVFSVIKDIKEVISK